MGQYYRPAIIIEINGKFFVIASMSPHMYSNGAKLMEHSYLGNNFVSAFEWLLTTSSPLHKSRVVWAGDYADLEVSEDGSEKKNLYHMAYEAEASNLFPRSCVGLNIALKSKFLAFLIAVAKNDAPLVDDLVTTVREELVAYYKTELNKQESKVIPAILVNHSKRVYIDKRKVVGEIHPLPLLTCEGNGRGGGDFRDSGTCSHRIGSWARDVISIDQTPPEGYTEEIFEAEE